MYNGLVCSCGEPQEQPAKLLELTTNDRAGCAVLGSPTVPKFCPPQEPQKEQDAPEPPDPASGCYLSLPTYIQPSIAQGKSPPQTK